MYDVAVLRRSARGRYPPSAPAELLWREMPRVKSVGAGFASARRDHGPRFDGRVKDLPQHVQPERRAPIGCLDWS